VKIYIKQQGNYCRAEAAINTQYFHLRRSANTLRAAT